MNKKELKLRHMAILGELNQIEETASKREEGNRALTAEEQQKFDALMREDAIIGIQLRGMATDAELAKMERSADMSAQLREYYQGLIKQERTDVTLTFVPKTTADGSSITESGAVTLKINEVMDTKLEGLGLPQGVTVLTGVTGDEVWPVNINDVEMEEVGEIEVVNEQAINFDNVKAVSRRISLAIGVSRKAIDFAAFDVYAYVMFKIRKALAMYLAKKVYSHANWNGNKGPFSLVTPGSLDLSTKPFENILMAAAEFAGAGFEGVPVVTIDKYTEAKLKATLKNPGVPGYIIENGLLAGLPYTTSGYIDKTLNGENELVDETDANGYKKHFFGIGLWEFFALQQHGSMTLVTDATSAAVAKANKVVSVFSTEISMTELSSKINGNQSGKPQAFALYELTF
ncbi:MAG: hypothetical protein II822_10475 [Prevotella sp.]|nr:hypothetical protein [Prevotella sp.]